MSCSAVPRPLQRLTAAHDISRVSGITGAALQTAFIRIAELKTRGQSNLAKAASNFFSLAVGDQAD